MIRKQKNTGCLEVLNCQECSKKIMYWSIGAYAFMTFLKLVSGALSGSSGLMADGLQSLACTFGAILIMYSLNISKKSANERFPYGYGRAEFIVSLVVYSILLGLGLFISLSSGILILKRTAESPYISGLPAAALSVFLNYMIYKYSTCAGKKLNDNSLIANAQQGRADMLSSSAVGVGIVLAQIGGIFVIFDVLAAFVVGILILKDAFHHWSANLKIVLDKVPASEYIEAVNRVVDEVFPDISLRVIKLKKVGKKFWIGLSLDLFDTDNVKKMQQIADAVRVHLRKRLSWVGEIDFFLSG